MKHNQPDSISLNSNCKESNFCYLHYSYSSKIKAEIIYSDKTDESKEYSLPVKLRLSLQVCSRAAQGIDFYAI